MIDPKDIMESVWFEKLMNWIFLVGVLTMIVVGLGLLGTGVVNLLRIFL